ncbi:MAG: RagB/SusD family nutrient uptake outer membrane protein [Cyclobacteriaceae bacterium]
MKKYIIIILTVLTVFSCESILDQEPVGNRTDVDFWQTEADMLDALAGAYSMWPTRNLGMHDLFFDNQGDDHWRAGDHAEDEDIETFNTSFSNYKIDRTYKDKYEVVSRANGIIINGPKVKELGTVSDASYNTIMGEAYFLRAYAYYRLYLIHGQVPIIEEEHVLSNNYKVPKCDSPEVLNAFIVADLEKAAGLLPMHNGAGRVGKGAAWAVLTSLHMHSAKDYADSENLNKAITAGQNVVDNYALADSYLSLFREGNEHLEENLFLMMNDMEWINQRLMSKHRGPRPWGAYGFQEPLDDLVNEYEEGDVRKDVTIISDGQTVRQGSLGEFEHTSDLSTTGHSYLKYLDWRESDGAFNHGLNIPFLRAADTYLLVAEAKIRLNGAGAGDDLINKVRKRTGLADVTNADIHDLIHETRVELAGENFRFQNLLRWDKAGIYDLEEFLSRPEKMLDRDMGRKSFSRPKNYYQPLPQVQIDNSDNVLVQNPLWVTGSN